MAHKTKIDGTNYKVVGGKPRIDDYNYKIVGGKTRIGGTNYNIMSTQQVVLRPYTGGGLDIYDANYAKVMINGQVYIGNDGYVNQNLGSFPTGTQIECYVYSNYPDEGYYNGDATISVLGTTIYKGRGIGYTHIYTLDRDVSIQIYGYGSNGRYRGIIGISEI